MAQRDLKKFFSNPPKGGNSAGVPTENPMGPLPSHLTSPHCDTYGGGSTIREKRIKAELAVLSPEERHERFMSQMEVRPGPDTGPDAITPLRDALEAGEASARHSRVQSSRARPSYYDETASPGVELRNFRRGPVETQEADDPSRYNAYDYEQASEGRPDNAGAKVQKPVPQPYPDTKQAVRSDGRPAESMGTPDGNVVRSNRTREFD